MLTGKQIALYTTIASGSFAVGFWKEYTGAEGFGPSAMLLGTPVVGAVAAGLIGPGKCHGDFAPLGEALELGGHGLLGAGFAAGGELAGMIAAYVVKRF